MTDEDIDVILAELNRCWPQILAGFNWTSATRHNNTAAAEIGKAFLDSAGGGADLEYQRSPQDLHRWSTAASDYAKRLQEPNDAAFLYRFAGIARVESGILSIAHETRTKVSDVLAFAADQLAKKKVQSDAIAPELKSES